MATSPYFRKDPDAVLDYKFDWSSYLETSETISSATITADTGITVDSDDITDDSTSVTVWLSGGTVGTEYKVACEVVTSLSRTDERSIYVRIMNL